MINVGALDAKHIKAGRAASKEELLTAEQVLQINVNGEPFTMTMRTPGDEQELVRGLLHSEDVIKKIAGTFRILTSCIDERGAITAVEVDLKDEELGAGLQSERSLMSVSSCGICGMKDMEDIKINGASLVTKVVLKPELIEQMFTIMADNQATFKLTGGSHASAAFNSKGELLFAMEDIGRHNAVDKVIGAMLLSDVLKQAEVILVSGRVSFEIISKAYKAGIPFLAAVSAPSTMAVELSKDLGITLMGFCRGDKMTVYSHSERISFQ